MGEKKFSRRKDLQDVLFCNTAHAGLWLDKFYDASIETDKVKPEQELVKQVASIKTPPPYKNFFARWKAALEQAGAKTRHAKTQGRLAINLGAESALETSIALHRTYGVPYIPGSALKGLAASFAHQYLEGDEWRKDTGDAHKELFGTTEQAGCVTFFDALYDPGTGHEGQVLWPDIITVHHPDYYQGKEISRGEKAPPADWDSPTPIPFLTATGTFLVALAGPDAWVETAFEILGLALMQEGIGAKTNSGYGRMKLVIPEPEQFDKFDRLPKPGERFKGTVFEPDDNGRVWMSIPGLDEEEVSAVLLPGNYPKGRTFREDEQVTCEVIKVQQIASKVWTVECKVVNSDLDKK